MNLKDSASNNLQYKFLFLLSTAYFATNVNVQGFLSLMPFIREEFQISRAQAGLYSTSYFLVATIVAIFAGSIVDKIGSKKGLVFGTTSVGILIIFHSLAPQFFVILILAFGAGLVFSIITPSLNKAVMKKVKPENRATSMGLMQMGGGVGGFLGASLLPLLGEIYGWRIAVIVSGLLAVGVGLFIFNFYNEKREENKEENESENSTPSFKNSLGVLFKNKQLLVVCGLGLGLSTAIGAIPNHYTMYLTQDLDISRSLAGLCLGILQIGGSVGRPGWGWISDHLLSGSRRLGLIVVGVLVIISTMFYSIYITKFNPSLLLIYISSFILGAVALGWMGLFFTTIAELVSTELTGIGTGFALIFTRMGVLLSPPLFGYIADVYGSYYLSWLAVSAVVFIFTIGFILMSKNLNMDT